MEMPDLMEWMKRSEQDRQMLLGLISTLASELGYTLEMHKLGGGQVRASWEKKSRLVSL